LFNHYESLLKQTLPNVNDEEIKRTVCDYISGMTDRYAVQKYEEIYIPQSLNNKTNDDFLFTLAKINNLSVQLTVL